MTSKLKRRDVLVGAGLSLGVLSAGIPAYAQSKARIVIVGGGFGGATAARFVKRFLPNATVTLIEANRVFTSCPFSNLVIAGLRDLSQQEFDLGALVGEGVEVVFGQASAVDAERKTVTINDDTNIAYDRLVLSPGVDMRWNAIEGYDSVASEIFPHAWKAGAQTRLLRRQLEALTDGETVIMTVPPAPYRCPPGPYERASLIAHYLKSQKPKSKLIVLDAKDQFSKMDLFQEAWSVHYPEHLEWRGALDDGAVSRVDTNSGTVFTDFESFSAPVINVIPPQKASWIADRAGVADGTGWCPINPLTFESTLQPDIHVIGDATIAAPMPKSAFSANLQGKICAAAIAHLMAGHTPVGTTLANTCYSYTAPDAAISIAGVYTNADGQLQSIPGAGGVSPLQAEDSVRIAEAAQAAHWFETITSEAFG